MKLFSKLPPKVATFRLRSAACARLMKGAASAAVPIPARTLRRLGCRLPNRSAIEPPSDHPAMPREVQGLGHRERGRGKVMQADPCRDGTGAFNFLQLESRR